MAEEEEEGYIRPARASGPRRDHVMPLMFFFSFFFVSGSHGSRERGLRIREFRTHSTRSLFNEYLINLSRAYHIEFCEFGTLVVGRLVSLRARTYTAQRFFTDRKLKLSAIRDQNISRLL
jgi:hypothetical protein